MNKTIKKQKSGNNSTNTQVETIVINNGLDYKNAKEIFLDLFKNNFLSLKNDAFTEIQNRINEFSESFIGQLQSRKIDNIEGIKDPGFQYSLFEAQKNYAKSGDKDMEAVMTDILLDRLSYNKRCLRQIVLDESIGIIPKLTNSQLDTLTILFLIKNTQQISVIDFEKLKNYLDTFLKPFINDLSKETSLYQHIEYTGCGSISIASHNIEDIFKIHYRGLFFEGFSEKTFTERIGNIQDYGNLIIKCLNNGELFQLNARNEETLKEKIKGLDNTIQQNFMSLFGQNILTNQQIKSKLIELGGSEIEKLFDIRDNSDIRNTKLTSVGITIAQANFRRKTGMTLDLSIWIK